MTTVTNDHELAEPHLRGMLNTLGLDVEYVRAEGNTLYFRGDAGQEIPVLDYVSGYGSLILGHNHPEIVARARKLLDERVAVHAQFSYHPYANDLALALNRVLWREFATDEPYSAIFASTGAEAVEIAIKHAELDRVIRLGELTGELEAHVTTAVEAARAGATVAASAYQALGTGDIGFDGLLQEVAGRNSAALSRPPLFLSLEGSFHGKLAGSVQLTHNDTYRKPFQALAVAARFVPVDQPGALGRILAEESASVFDLVVDGEQIKVVERDAPVIAGFFVEPIQGEGGIHVLGAVLAREIRRAADAVGFPVIVDEIQSGFGRSGAFFASSFAGLLGDYYVLAKSLGGGIAKSSVLLVRQRRYRSDFELVHSSTFAKDAFSCHIGLKVLELLEAEDGAAYRAAAERGERLKAAMNDVLVEFPDVVRAVRGRGLMLGIEFEDQSASTSDLLRENARAGMFGYLVASYLLREHRIRLFPTASAAHTLRVEPSIHITDEEIDRLRTGLLGVATILRAQDGVRLVAS